MTTSRHQIRAVGVTLGVALGSFVIGAILLMLVSQVLSAVGISLLDRPALRLGLSTVLLQGVTFGGVALVYLQTRDSGLEFIQVRVPTRRDVAWIVGGFITLLVAVRVLSVVIAYLGFDHASNQIIEIGRQEPTVFLVLIPLSFLLVGPGEELLFRGLIQGTLRESFHPARAIILASLIFAMVHVFSLQGSGKLVYIGVVFTLALVLGATYELTDNLAVPALIHGAYNAVQFGLAYYTVTQGTAL
ncbi:MULTISPECIES: type II CAAX endopeptidase family protein [unclassified Haloferax]|uniref:CPBP family intramembrane glutamic endopeptidase n=1 Tax=unclassified Haloferax TaxID=2625095 RepID=UPI00287709E0|nr:MULTISPECIES: type II CAAX endopeptidase family protein [unclassified Haloferax]MDS0243792.1 CPBP family intramembrane metalloprotease [Haloferax sp. S2CR25]MDS0446913.1 CPBP family intramembrane metalloprotease [Haloferax sp. S2CR25-2]